MVPDVFFELNDEIDEEMRSSKVSFWSIMFDFRIVSLSILDVDSNLEFFMWINFDSNEDWNNGLNSEQEDRIEISEIVRMTSVSEAILKCVDSVEISSSW